MMEDLGKYVIKNITGRTYWKGRDETLEEARWALYSIIIYANEYGQPKSQDLADGDSVSICILYKLRLIGKLYPSDQFTGVT
jgi:hypothetical protein